ncbi:DUF2254 domain-containing protein [Demequina sp. NBRC 110052]|uniref:DUF2254 domain-containing protein n=1 Tax=Demequina sp. NBRC 110052 TaxID=1570341 RepID=UPI0013563255|nr:DUF2254 domain-containing protein [Demequina sp. NBRC 110052]
MGAFDWRTFLARLPRRIGFRLSLFTVGALALVFVAAWAAPLLEGTLSFDFGQDAVANLLQILATSMLAVTTFSLTAMISAYAAAAQGTTPRATQLLIADTTSQNALSTFLGAFVFAIVGLVGLSTGGFGDAGKSVLFAGTLIVIAVVVGTLLRWIHHLTTFGRVPDVIDRVEAAATDAVRAFACDPHLGGVAPVAVPDGAAAVGARSAGYVTGIDMARLHEMADAAGVTVHVDVLPGAFVGLGTDLGRVTGTGADADVLERMCGCFRVEKHRTYEQDPRLGLVALAEIGSRALSPAVNDPGTAVEVLGAITRVMTVLFTESAGDDDAPYPRIHVPQVTVGELTEDALRPLARDGAAQVEVSLRIQKVLGELVRLAPDDDAVRALGEASVRALRRAKAGLTDESDAALVEAAAASVRGHAGA